MNKLGFGLTAEQLQEAADYLNKLGMGQVKRTSPCGICYNLQMHIGWECGCGERGCYKLIAKYSQSWPLYSGSEDYPVPRTKICRRWEGEQLALRSSLCFHLVDKIEELLKEHGYGLK